jgi:hypothetical protein
MSNPIDDDSMDETLKDSYKASQRAGDAPEYSQERSIIHSFYFKLYSEKRTLEKDKQAAKEKDNLDDHRLVQIQSMLDFVNELLSIDGLEELAQQSGSVENPEPSDRDAMPFNKIERKLLFIKAVVCALDYEPLAIPTGGKTKIKAACLKATGLFTESVFEHAWKEARRRDLVKLRDNDKYKPG